jgi:hypothetical protein
LRAARGKKVLLTVARADGGKAVRVVIGEESDCEIAARGRAGESSSGSVVFLIVCLVKSENVEILFENASTSQRDRYDLFERIAMTFT